MVTVRRGIILRAQLEITKNYNNSIRAWLVVLYNMPEVVPDVQPDAVPDVQPDVDSTIKSKISLSLIRMIEI